MTRTKEAREVTVNAIAAIAKEERAARQVLGELSSCLATQWSGKEEYEKQLSEALEYRLVRLGRRLPILLDLLGMSDTRESLLQRWRELTPELGKTAFEMDETYGGYLVSEPLDLASDIVRVLAGADEQLSAEAQMQAAQLEILEYVLRSTPQMLRSRGVIPTRELDVQGQLDIHLEHTFPDYSKTIRLPKGLKSFQPDGAIPSLEALIEVKFITSLDKAKRALSEVKEDLSGYGGTRDWTRFYSLVYQTDAFVAEKRFGRSLRLSGNAARWKAVVVTGTSMNTSKRPSTEGE